MLPSTSITFEKIEILRKRILRSLLMVKFDLYVINQGLPVNSSHAELPDVSQKSKSISDW